MNLLRTAIGSFLLLAPLCVQADSYDESLNKMRHCESSEECGVVAEICTGWTAINKNAQHDYEEYYKKMGRVIDCPEFKAIPKPASAACVSNLCVVKE